jgi:hypothetical protein
MAWERHGTRICELAFIFPFCFTYFSYRDKWISVVTIGGSAVCGWRRRFADTEGNCEYFEERVGVSRQGVVSELRGWAGC